MQTTTKKYLHEMPVGDAVSLALKILQKTGSDLQEKYPYFSGGYQIAHDGAIHSRSTFIRFMGSEVIHDYRRFQRTFSRSAWPTICRVVNMPLQHMSPLAEINVRDSLDVIFNHEDLNMAPIVVDNDGYIILGDTSWLSKIIQGPSSEVEVFKTSLSVSNMFPMVMAFEKTD
jgi:hypothetical protein